MTNMTYNELWDYGAKLEKQNAELTAALAHRGHQAVMIELNLYNTSEKVLVNPSFIVHCEGVRHDLQTATIVTLSDKKQFVVVESIDEIRRLSSDRKT